ncbi:MAG: phage tail sheath protein, partial [Oscillospiraceae bacterium]|nr:phage tail sheath protein [Oscillospiraceae bacterium]
FNGVALETLESCAKMTENDIQRLIAAGVTVLEQRGGVRCIRAVTTRTSTNGVADYSLRSLSTTRIIDAVISSIRDTLAARLAGTRISMQGVASQVAAELMARQDEGLIEQFDAPSVRALEGDPSVALCALSFKVAHVLSQIHISAHIRL